MLTIFWCIRGKGQLPAVMDTVPALVFGGLRCEHGAGGARQLLVEPSLCRGARPSASTFFLTSLLSRYFIFIPHSKAIPEGASAKRHYSIFEPWALKL